MTKFLDGRVAIVTGAARGIGEGCALALAQAGAHTVIADLDGDAADEGARKLKDAGLSASAVTVDVSQEEQVATVVSRIVEVRGRIDILVNNAADLSGATVSGDRKIVDLQQAVWDRVMAVNLRGHMLTSKHVLPHMLSQRRGVVINVSSTAGLQGGEHVRAAYASSKAGVIALTRATASQYGKCGVRAIALAPGLIMTPAVVEHADEKHLAVMARHHLTPRLGTIEDIGAVAAFLVSDAAGFITGCVIPVDGGFSSHSPALADELANEHQVTGG